MPGLRKKNQKNLVIPEVVWYLLSVMSEEKYIGKFTNSNGRNLIGEARKTSPISEVAFANAPLFIAPCFATFYILYLIICLVVLSYPVTSSIHTIEKYNAKTETILEGIKQ